MTGLHRLGAKRILVAEDYRPIADIVRTRLSVLGFVVRLAFDGGVAVKAVEDFKPDAMILDLNMPVLDGFQVMRTLGPSRMLDLPTLVLTARHGADDVRQAIALGARDYLAKPFSEAQLTARLGRLLRKPSDAVIRTMVVVEEE